MYILGLNAYHADSSAAIFNDGVLIAATEEERFTRIKHWAGSPSKAIEFCLKEAGVTLEQVDWITIGRNPKAKLSKKLWFVLSSPMAGYHTVKSRLQNRKEISSLEKEFSNNFGIDEALIQPKIRYVEHHRSHMASAFFPSPFEEAAILSIDDFTTTMIGTGKGNKIKVIDSVDFPVSCGLFYTAFTQFLGFPHYGEPKYAHQVRNVLKLKDDGLFGWNALFILDSYSNFLFSLLSGFQSRWHYSISY